MSEIENQNVIIIDPGSHTIKAGFSSEKTPKLSFPSVIGRTRFNGVKVGIDQKRNYVGYEYIKRRGILYRHRPVIEGLFHERKNYENKVSVHDSDAGSHSLDMEEICQHIFYEQLRVDPGAHHLLLIESMFNKKAQRELLTQIMFETYFSPAVYLGLQSVLSLYASGRKTGLVVDSGGDVTRTVPVLEGHAIPNAIQKIFIGGNTVNEYLSRILRKGDLDQSIFNYQKLTLISSKSVGDDIKEKYCYVASDFSKEMLNSKIKNQTIEKYILPDGETITLGNEIFQGPECFFNPTVLEEMGISMDGPNDKALAIHQAINLSIKSCDSDLSNEFYNNICLAGGNSNLPGFSNRLYKELSLLSSNKIDIQVAPGKQNSAWIGGSLLSNLSNFKNMCITEMEYYEYGPSIVHRKCF